jgi:ABC-2 type transport system ATP-binding protein
LIAQLGGKHIVTFSVTAPDATALVPDTWRDLPAVTACRYEGGTICLTVSEPHIALPALLKRLAERNWQLASLVTRHASLDDVFVALSVHEFEPVEEAEG